MKHLAGRYVREDIVFTKPDVIPPRRYLDVVLFPDGRYLCEWREGYAARDELGNPYRQESGHASLLKNSMLRLGKQDYQPVRFAQGILLVEAKKLGELRQQLKKKVSSEQITRYNLWRQR